MKSMLALLMTAVLLLSVCPVLGEEDTAASALVVANPTPLRGQFFTDLWGNTTSDIDVRDLLHAYNLICWDAENGMFTVDPSVVTGLAVTADVEGNHTYNMVLANDLFYSDGSRITAWDYAFSFLFTISPEVSQIGGTPLRREQIMGSQQYVTGRPLSGVRVLADDTLSVTLNHEYLPFFYEMGLLSCVPYPISVIAPGVAVRDDGQGVYLANTDESVTPNFTATLLNATVLDPETGYLSHPSVVSGPYTLSSWDGVTAVFDLNPYYKGNRQGEKPAIAHLTYTLPTGDTMIEELSSGKIDMVNKATRADAITAGMALAGEDGYAMSTYPRVGLSYISFCCERETVSSTAVRQAIAYCFDRDAVTTGYTGPFGQRVDSYYGVGQWMYSVVMGTTPAPIDPPENEQDTAGFRAYEEALAAYEALSLEGLNPYALDTEAAARLLEADGWQLNAEGVREKNGVQLNLTLLYPEGNNIQDLLEENLAAHLREVGIRLSMRPLPMTDLLQAWYQQGARDADMIYLGSNFDLIFDPSTHFQVSDAGHHTWSYTNLNDAELYADAVAMRQTQPGDVLTYMQRWVSFEERFNQVLPMIPVYSNVYFDFYIDRLQHYAITESVTWGQAIVGAYLGDEAEEEAIEWSQW